MRIITFLLILFGSKLLGQVGIGNTLPEKSLHISGSSSSEVVSGTSINLVKPTIRIDGLNNGNQLITDKIRPVSVTDQGDLVLAPALVKPLVMIDSFNPTNSETDYLASSITTNQTTTTLTTNIVLRSFNFSLDSPSLVRVGAVTSFQFFRADNGNPVTDESNRQWGTRFRFSSAPAGVSTVSTAYFGESLKGYYNRVSNTSATEILYSNSEDIQYLPAGNYTLEVIATTITATGQSPLRVVNGSGSDTFSVIAYPIQ